MTRLRGQVFAFMNGAGQKLRSHPNQPPITDADVKLRCRLVIEEAFELLEACIDDDRVRALKNGTLALISESDVDLDIVAAADAMADLDYVVEGTRLNFGIDGGPVADEVHRTNMEKVLDGTIDEHGKVRKPTNWQPPDVAGVLKGQGWKR